MKNELTKAKARVARIRNNAIVRVTAGNKVLPYRGRKYTVTLRRASTVTTHRRRGGLVVIPRRSA